MCFLTLDWIIGGWTYELKLPNLLCESKQEYARVSENFVSTMTLLKSILPNWYLERVKGVRRYSISSNSTLRRVWLNPLSFRNKWQFVPILNVYLKQALCLEQRIHLHIDICVNSQAWTLKWYLRNTTMKFSSSVLTFWSIFSRESIGNAGKNWNVSANNIKRNLSSGSDLYLYWLKKKESIYYVKVEMIKLNNKLISQHLKKKF